ncbi:MAG TPA: ATP-binding protein [Candidatus Binatia bacterium]|nr:ATP-binding protein [Candidatus Binatia bacterium]
MPRDWTEHQLPSGVDATDVFIGGTNKENQEFLLRAFRSFAHAAASLEASYANLRAEVERLERELAASNSEVVRTSEENAQMRAYLDRILENLPCGVLVASSGGEVLRANSETRRVLGPAAGDGELVSLCSLPDSVRELLQRSRMEEDELEQTVGNGQHNVRWLAVRHALLREGGDIFILRDISERKRLDEIEARLQRECELAAISRLLAHEIRNPLGSLELFAGLLMESDLDDEQRSWVEHVRAGLRTLAAIVNNVLHFHSLPPPQLAPVDLGKLLDWSRGFFLPLGRQSQVTFSLQNHLAGVVIPADRHRLEQVLLNLILNSVQMMPEGGWVELGGRRTRSEGTERAVVTVADTGPGIPPEDLGAIFEPGVSRRAGNSGLGLSVCRKIIEQHGGAIHAANRSQHGAIFTVTFPLTDVPEGVQK